MEILMWIIGLVVFFTVLSVSVALHELGHLSVAKMFKLSIPKYFVGFGPTLWSRKIKGTDAGVKAIPLGGFVLIEDDKYPEKSEERSLLSHVSPWKRVLIYLAGPAVNIVLGTVILMGVMLAYPVQYVTTSIDKINTCSTTTNCGAETAGLKSGDKIIAIDGKNIQTAEDIAPLLANKSNALVTVLRDNKNVDINVGLNNNKLGVDLGLDERNLTFVEASDRMGELFILNVHALAELPSKLPGVINNIFGAQKEEDAPSSIVAAGKTYGDTTASTTLTTDDKVHDMLIYSGLLNIGIGFVNLLPFMPLDGGRIVVAMMDSAKMAWSKLRKRNYSPTTLKFIGYMTIVTGSMVFAFMGLLILSDVLNIFRGQM